jgi:hypothetical protein
MHLPARPSRWSFVSWSLLGFVSLAHFATARAETPKLAPVMTEAGATISDDSFAQALPKTWRAAKGTWVVEGGVLRGTEVKAEQHQAVVRHPLTVANAVIAFSFRLGQSRQISLSVNDAKEHVCRVIINANGFTVQKDDHDHAGPDKAVVFARVAMALDANAWHTAVVEMHGAELVAQIDAASHIGFGAHALLDRPKANFGFTSAGGTAEFRDVKVSEAKPRADWAETKRRLAAK